MKTILVTLFASTLLIGCKKNYTCSCTNPGGVGDAFTIKDTKCNAQKTCSDYYTKTYGSIPLNETSCSIK